MVVKAQKRHASPSRYANAPSKALIFSLSDEELTRAIAMAIAEEVRPEEDARAPEDLQAFNDARFGLEGQPFDGSFQAVFDLLRKITGAGLEARALIVALVIIQRIVSRTGRSATLDSGDAGWPGPVGLTKDVARPLIASAALLSSKYNYDEGVRVKHVRKDEALRQALGDRLVGKIGKLEEHILVLLDWQIRVSPADYTAAYVQLMERAKADREADGRPPIRVQSMPDQLATLA